MRLAEIHAPSYDQYLADLVHRGFNMSKVKNNEGYVLSTFNTKNKKQTVKSFGDLAAAKAAAPEETENTPWIIYNTSTGTVEVVPAEVASMAYYMWAKLPGY